METTSEDKKKAARRESRRAASARYNARNKIKAKEYREKNSERIKTYDKKRYSENVEKVRLYHKNYYIENVEIVKIKNRKYQIENVEKVRIYKSNYKKNRLKIDPLFKMVCNLRRRVQIALKRQSTKKSIKTEELLGASIEIVWNHIESQFKEGMTRENYGHIGWHIDHIIPCASFDLSDSEEQKKCFHYTNLQPLWWWENLSKGNKILT